MEKKQTKEFAKIIIISFIILITTISIVFTSLISKNIKNFLYKQGVKVGVDDMVVHFIQVGQGDAIAIRLPNEQVILIDAGPKESQNNLVEYIKNKVLKNNNDLTIDYLILTHSDIDHSGGMCALFSEFDIKNFFRPNIASSSENKSDFAMESQSIEYNEVIISSTNESGLNTNVINKRYEFNLGQVLVQIFPPVGIYYETNDMSPLIKVTYLDRSFLFVGDIQERSEKDMFDRYLEYLDADVLKVAHHGSNTSSSVEFVSAVSPKYAVICVGKNDYGHPHFSTIRNLEQAGAKVLTTELDSVEFVCGRDGLVVLENKTHSFEFIEWWIIAIIIDGILLIILTKSIIVVIKKHKEKFN